MTLGIERPRDNYVTGSHFVFSFHFTLEVYNENENELFIIPYFPPPQYFLGCLIYPGVPGL